VKISGYLSPNVRCMTLNSRIQTTIVGIAFEAERTGNDVHLTAKFSDETKRYSFPTLNNIRPDVDLDQLIVDSLSRKYILSEEVFDRTLCRQGDDPVIKQFGDKRLGNFEICVKRWLDQSIKSRLPKLRKAILKASDEYEALDYQIGDFVLLENKYLNFTLVEFYRVMGIGFGYSHPGSLPFRQLDQGGIGSFFAPALDRGFKGTTPLRLFYKKTPSAKLSVFVKPVFSNRGPIAGTNGHGKNVAPDRLQKTNEQEVTKAFIDWTFSDLT